MLRDRNCSPSAGDWAAGARSIAFPAISTGIYGYPKAPAARIAVDTVSAALGAQGGFAEVLFCCFSGGDLTLYRSLLTP